MVAPNDNRFSTNRANAAKSTGPRTEAGKARSSMNAVKHGLTAQTALLPGEDAGELRGFAESVEAQLRPVGALQKILAQRVVAVAWKLRRVSIAEEKAALKMDEEKLARWEQRGRMAAELPFAVHRGPRPRPRDAGTLLADSFLEFSGGEVAADGRFVRITAYELKLEGALRATLRELRALQTDENFAPRDPEEPTTVPDAEPAPTADPEKPPQRAAAEPPGDAARDAEIPQVPAEKPLSQNEPGTNGEPEDSARNESAGP